MHSNATQADCHLILADLERELLSIDRDEKKLIKEIKDAAKYAIPFHLYLSGSALTHLHVLNPGTSACSLGGHETAPSRLWSNRKLGHAGMEMRKEHGSWQSLWCGCEVRGPRCWPALLSYGASELP